MVSFWPFGRRDDNSPDSFERVLAKLTSQIQAKQTRLNTLRTQSRRYKALWTLYTIIAWMLYMVVLVLLVGRADLTVKEVAGAVGGPILIYGGRQLLVYIYEWRISKAESALADLMTERSGTIEKLKTATKFYSTQSLLEKYGGGSEMTDDTRGMMSRKGSMAGIDGMHMGPQQPGYGTLRQRQVSPQQQQQQPGSIRGKPQHLQPPGQPQMPQQQPPQPIVPNPEAPESLSPQQVQIQEQLRQQQQLRPISAPGQPIPPSTSNQPSPTRSTFLPGQSPPPPSVMLHQPPSTTFPPETVDYIEPETASQGGSRWYDRLLDVLIGEDETATKNRYALICGNCRMVNGLAPPGTKSLKEVGRWGCARCGAMNGKDYPKGKAENSKKGDVTGVGAVKDQIEREIAEEMLANSVKRGSGRSRGSIRGWTKQIQELQAQEEEAEDADEGNEEQSATAEKASEGEGGGGGERG